MNCLRKRFLASLISFALLVLFSTGVSADYTSISLSPSAGTIYGDTSTISVLVNSGTEEFVGVDVNLAFTGSVEYLSSSGASRCSSFRVTPGSGTINIECLSTAHTEGESYSGVIATLYFKSTGTGTSTFTFSSTDPNIATKTGGTYTLSTEDNPDGSGASLPDSGIFDDTRVIIISGLFLILIGVFFNRVSESILIIKERGKQKLITKRRDNLEKKF